MRRFPVVLIAGALLMGAGLAACGDDSGSSRRRGDDGRRRGDDGRWLVQR